ncbi:MAG: hypothetical protein IJY59_06230 [Bacteroidaceae bacterium]|nr:hypothetical protein [Bacteroidaceae bacterium]
MKRKTGWYAVLATCMVSLLWGCSDQESLAPINESSQVVLKASAETKSVSRSALSDEGVFSWLKEDRIDVYASDGLFHEFALTDGEGTNSGVFTGKLTEGTVVEQYAVSPAGLSPSLTNGTLSLTLPNAYTWQEQQTHALMLSKIEDSNTISFKNLGGLVKLYIRNIENGCRVEVTSSTHQLAGTMTVCQNAEGIEVLQAVSQTTSDMVTFTSTSTNEKQAFYLPLPITGEEKMKLNVKVYDAAENGTLKMEKNATLSIHRKELILMPSLTFPEAEKAVVQDVTSTEDVNAALVAIADSIANTENKDISITINSNSNLNEDEEASATVEVAAAIEIPATITAPETGGGEDGDTPATTTSHVKITFDEVPQATDATDNKVVLTDKQKKEELTSTESKSEVEVAIPEAPEGVEPPSFEISLPTTTVTLTATQETATFNEVWATTADNTLNVAKGVTIKNLYVLSGNVKVTGHIDKVVSQAGKTVYITLSGDGTVGTISGDVVVEHENDKFFTDFANESVANGQNIPYEIATLEQLRSLANRVAGNHRDAYDRPYRECTYLLVADIDLGINQLWKPIGTEASSFSGVFNGNGHKITGVMNMGECDNAGFFGRIYNRGTIQNLTIATDIKIINDTVKTSDMIGALSGNIDGAVIENCHFVGNISIGAGNIGGMVGTSTGGTYRLCSNTGSITNLNSNATVGGIVGIDNNSSLTGCYSTADLTFADESSTGTSGGMVGRTFSSTTLTACWTNVKMNGKVNGALLGKGGSLNATASYWNYSYKIVGEGSWSTYNVGSFGGDTPAEEQISIMNPYISEWGWKYNENGVLVPLEKNTIPSNPIKPW